MIVRDVVTAVLLLSGAGFSLLGALGLLRFPDVPTRLQAATKPQTLGLLLVLAGAALRADAEHIPALVLAGLFQVITAPVLAQLFGRAAYRTGDYLPSVLVADELAERLRDEGGRPTDPPG
ncbi:multisubunit sodium/proton antiporter MrpG subunit [Prauserella shujinwangii]|uniref:Multisubunit sodium/proton antiporter MrpG subunit n=1 Tax=Prauserella shujinwangii TaxID=1453103 RepID=A0A2T0LRX3_9PSEU|nr:monovalent cation/H(+) antiporter subunit G [Prauserella shujinwangii]PRX46195.1 multisubunit sodium/proton antiporter MrpG subunit [Prauserella shujinwangii]